jgi:hypothetical protein
MLDFSSGVSSPTFDYLNNLADLMLDAKLNTLHFRFASSSDFLNTHQRVDKDGNVLEYWTDWTYFKPD